MVNADHRPLPFVWFPPGSWSSYHKPCLLLLTGNLLTTARYSAYPVNPLCLWQSLLCAGLVFAQGNEKKPSAVCTASPNTTRKNRVLCALHPQTQQEKTECCVHCIPKHNKKKPSAVCTASPNTTRKNRVLCALHPQTQQEKTECCVHCIPKHNKKKPSAVCTASPNTTRKNRVLCALHPQTQQEKTECCVHCIPKHDKKKPSAVCTASPNTTRKNRVLCLAPKIPKHDKIFTSVIFGVTSRWWLRLTVILMRTFSGEHVWEKSLCFVQQSIT